MLPQKQKPVLTMLVLPVHLSICPSTHTSIYLNKSEGAVGNSCFLLNNLLPFSKASGSARFPLFEGVVPLSDLPRRKPMTKKSERKGKSLGKSKTTNANCTLVVFHESLPLQNKPTALIFQISKQLGYCSV